MQIAVCHMGLIVTMLSITAIIIWWRKRPSGRYQRARQAATLVS